MSWYEKRGAKYLTTDIVSWEIGRKGSGRWIDVPRGFLFEPSIPFPATTVLDPDNPKYLKAACVHDYLRHIEQWDRMSSGGVFHEILKADGVPKRERLAMWAAVSLAEYS